MFGRATPLGVLGASLLFGLAYALTLRMQGIGIPPQFVAMLPYLATLGVLVAVAVRRRRRERRAVAAIDADRLEQADPVAPAVR
jgi:simple sugar transport system permease protein